MPYIRQRYIAIATLLGSLGFLFLLNNFKLLRPIDFGYVWIIWPLVLILFAIYFVVKGTKFAPFITIATSALTALVLFAALTVFSFPFLPKVDTGRENSTNPNIDLTDSNIFKPLDKANLVFKSSRVNLSQKGTTPWSLTEYETKTTYGEYIYERIEKDGVETADLRFSEDRFPWNFSSDKNEIDLKLNEKPVWKLDYEVSTNSNIDLDLSYYKISDLRLKTSTSSAKINLENSSFDKNINFEIDSVNASRIELRLPKEVGVEVKLKSTLSQNDLSDLKKVEGEQDLYRSENFSSSEKKIFLDIDTSLSTFKLELF